jgi:hypothetical protein
LNHLKYTKQPSKAVKSHEGWLRVRGIGRKYHFYIGGNRTICGVAVNDRDLLLTKIWKLNQLKKTQVCTKCNAHHTDYLLLKEKIK